QLLVIDDGGGLEVPRQRVCCIGISGVISLGCRQNRGRRGVEHSFVRPSNGGRLRSPNLARIFFGLAEAPGVAGLVQELLFPVKAQIIPIEIVFASILFRVADDLSVAFAEEGDSRLWYVRQGDSLCGVIIACADPERSEAIRELRLKIGAI